MLRIRPFPGLRPADHLAHVVACVPYDVVDMKESRELAADNPYSLLHVDRAEIDLPDDTNPCSDQVYNGANAYFQKLQKEGTLIRENEPCLYLYKLTMDGREQRGLAATCHIEDYENNIILKHEKTRKDKEDDRTRLIGTLRADTGPVFLTYRGTDEIDKQIAEIETAKPLYQFTAPDGIGHAVWRIPGGEALAKSFANVPVSYVADGHHRTASAVRVGKELREKNPGHTGNEDYNWFLCVLFPAHQLRILPYNRAVADLNGNTPGKFLSEVKAKFSVEKTTNPSPTGSREVCMYLGNQWYRITWPEDPAAGPVASLDVSVLQDQLLAPLLGIADPRTSQRIDFIGGIRGTRALVEKVDSGKAAVAFSMYPVTVDQLMAIADAGEIMPPKSTWFEPKLRSGLFIHTF
jgi:uncharacterized protein (DUF1015 family)